MATWNTVVWNSGDICEKAKFNNMLHNNTYVREEGCNYNILFAGNVEYQTTSINTNVSVEVLVNGTGTFASTGGTIGTNSPYVDDTDRGPSGYTEMNFDFSALAPGLNAIVVSFENIAVTREYRFVKTDTMNYISMWITVRGDTGQLQGTTIGAYDLTIIAHPELESWV